MSYYNTINRFWIVHNNKNASKKLNFCYCNDCSLENKILSEYDEKNVLHNVKLINKFTNIPLTIFHTLNRWENINKNTNPIKLKKIINDSIQNQKTHFKHLSKKLKRKKKQRGETGKNIN